MYTPKIGKQVFIHPSATVHGKVTLKDYVSIWPGVVLRGDLNQIVIGSYTNIQDLSVVHVERSLDCRIGEYCVVGHSVILHGCKVGDGVLVGMGAIVLNESRIGSGALIGAGALVPEGSRLEPETLYLGMPAKKVRKLTRREVRFTIESAKRYVQLAKRHKADEFRDYQS